MSNRITGATRAKSSELYLDLLQKSLCDTIYGENKLERWIAQTMQRIRHPYATRHGTVTWPLRAHSMIGPEGLRILRTLIDRTIDENIPGDYIETGVWRGGASILMRGALAARDIHDRRIFCADSFEGLPRPDAKYPADKRDRLFRFSELAISEAEVRQNFASYGLLDDQVVFVKGLFKDTLPKLHEQFALLRLDGDMYESTMDALTSLYDMLSPGGFVIVDDYLAIKSCAKAVHDFLDSRSISPELHRVDHTEVWFEKPMS